MLTLSGIVLLVALILVRPQELSESLSGVPFLYAALALTALGVAADLFSNKSTLERTPVTTWALVFFGWCVLTLVAAVGLSAPELGWEGLQRMVICVVLCLIVAHGVQTPRALNVVGATTIACAVLIASLAIYQGLSPRQCVGRDNSMGMLEEGKVDGRGCATESDCYNRWGARPGMAYNCEGVGIFGTTTIANGRVRWVGVLHDPNDLALTVGAALPIAFALRREKKTLSRTTLAVLATLLIIACVILTRSRGGQLVVLAVFGTYFLVRSGMRGVIAAVVLAVPALVYGGRGDARASDSTVSRLDAWWEGVEMMRNHPVFGVGHGRFEEHHFQTAHNSYLLAGAELGILGLTLFVAVLYAAAKIPWVAMTRYQDADDPRRAWAIGLLAALAGASVGAFFLSFTYHPVLWLFIGLAGAFYTVVRRADPGFALKWRMRDTLMVPTITVVVLAALYVITRYIK